MSITAALRAVRTFGPARSAIVAWNGSARPVRTRNDSQTFNDWNRNKGQHMPLIAKGGNKTEFEPCPEGPQQAVCCDVIDLGNVEVTWQGQTKVQHKCEIRWQSADLMPNGKPYLLRERFTVSLSEKSRLRPFLEAWRGKKFTEAEIDGFDIERLLGANCYINVVHNKGKKGGTFANVASVMPLPKGMPAIQVTDYVRMVDRTPDEPQNHGEAQGFDEAPPITDDDIPF